MRIQIVLCHALLLGILVARCQANLQINVGGLTPAQIVAILEAINKASNGTYTAEDVDECDQTDSCPTGSSCLNNVGSYNCTCDSGYVSGGNGDTGDAMCNDVDECVGDATICEPIVDSTCQNEPGGYECTCAKGYENVESACLDINECNGDPCASISGSTCNNTDGSYECNCDGGYQKNADTTECEDIDECVDLAICSEEQNSECANSAGGYSCNCLTGFEKTDGICNDIIECDRDPNPCASISDSSCENSEGSHVCTCETGFQINTDTSACKDIDECDPTFSIAHDCGENEVCVNGVGNYTCECAGGFSPDPSGACSDQDECDSNPCDGHAFCHNLAGEYNCICLSGFFGSGNPGNCTDVLACSTFDTLTASILGIQNADSGADISTFEENLNDYNSASGKADGVSGASFRKKYGSELNSHIVNVIDELRCDFFSTCTESAVDGKTTYTCACVEGYQYVTDSTTQCEDIDECAGDEPCGSMATCQNHLGSYTCTCPDGYEIAGDVITVDCTDIDECSNELHNCDTNAECKNTDASFTCTCKDGFMGSGQECKSALSCEAYDNVKLSIDTIRTAEDGNDTSEADMLLGYYIAATGRADGVDGASYRENFGSELTDTVSTAVDLLRCDYFSNCSASTGVEGAATYSCSCISGYAPVPDNINQCLDEDECTLQGEDACGVTGTCENQQGTYMCNCNNGFKGGKGAPCSDIDECTLESHECGVTGTCANKVGGYSCDCNSGYEGGDDGPCTNINECDTKTDSCHDDATCTDIDGSFTCACNGGHTGNGMECEDINECVDGNHTCDTNGMCTNVHGSFECSCLTQFMGTGQENECKSVLTCDAFNDVKFALGVIQDSSSALEAFEAERKLLQEYSAALGRPAGVTQNAFRARFNTTDTDVENTLNTLRCDYFATCSYNETEYSCQCIVGYEADTENGGCKDVNECAEDDLHECHSDATCTNVEGSYNCKCNDGYFGDGTTTCSDLNECNDEGGGHDCDDVHATCENIAGGHTCTCNETYFGDGTECQEVNTCEAFNNIKSAIAVIQASDSTDDDISNDRKTLQEYNQATSELSGISGNSYRYKYGDTLDADITNVIDKLICDYHSRCSEASETYTCTCDNDYIPGSTENTCLYVQSCATFERVRSAINTVREHSTADETAEAAREVLRAYTDANGHATAVEGVSYRARYGNITDEQLTSALDLLSCDYFSECTDTLTCTCIDGYQSVDESNACVDIDECAEEPCGSMATCQNMFASYTCTCPVGYKIAGEVITAACTDIDECSNDELHNCHSNAECRNTPGSFTCTCKDGFMGSGQECESALSCDAYDKVKQAIDTIRTAGGEQNTSEAEMLLGYYNTATGKAAGVDGASYRAKFELDLADTVSTVLDLLRCDYFSDCSESNGEDGVTTYSCTCITGYDAVSETINQCQDINECAGSVHICHTVATCTNVEGSYNCECNDGYFGNGNTCSDHDECSGQGGGHDCNAHATCDNIEGGHTCTCNETYYGNGTECQEVNTCETFNNIKSAIDVIQASDSSDGDISNARETLQEYHQATGKIGEISGNSYRYKSGETLNDDITSVIDKLICDYHSICTGESEAYTCTCDNDHIPGSTENTCLHVQSCATFERVKVAIDAVREHATDETAAEAAREVLMAYTNASGHATEVDGASYRARYGEITDDQLTSTLDLLPCDYFSECTDTLTCSCINGYQSVNESNACSDVDECKSEFDNECHTNAACSNSEGSYECACNAGFEGDGRQCTDQDECSGVESPLCGSNAECSDTVGSYECACREGYSGDGQVCVEEATCLFNEDSDGEVADCSTYDHPLSCTFRQEVPVRAERHFDTYRAFMQPPKELVSSSAATRDEATLTASLKDTSDVSFCKKSTTYASPSKAYSDVDETMEVELFSYDCHRQWFTVTECAGTSENINAQCTTIKTPQSGLVITKDATTGKYEVKSQMIYLPSSCQLGFSIAT